MPLLVGYILLKSAWPKGWPNVKLTWDASTGGSIWLKCKKDIWKFEQTLHFMLCFTEIFSTKDQQITYSSVVYIFCWPIREHSFECQHQEEIHVLITNRYISFKTIIHNIHYFLSKTIFYCNYKGVLTMSWNIHTMCRQSLNKAQPCQDNT